MINWQHLFKKLLIFVAVIVTWELRNGAIAFYLRNQIPSFHRKRHLSFKMPTTTLQKNARYNYRSIPHFAFQKNSEKEISLATIKKLLESEDGSDEHDEIEFDPLREVVSETVLPDLKNINSNKLAQNLQLVDKYLNSKEFNDLVNSPPSGINMLRETVLMKYFGIYHTDTLLEVFSCVDEVKSNILAEKNETKIAEVNQMIGEVLKMVIDRKRIKQYIKRQLKGNEMINKMYNSSGEVNSNKSKVTDTNLSVMKAIEAFQKNSLKVSEQQPSTRIPWAISSMFNSLGNGRASYLHRLAILLLPKKLHMYADYFESLRIGFGKKLLLWSLFVNLIASIPFALSLDLMSCLYGYGSGLLATAILLLCRNQTIQKADDKENFFLSLFKLKSLLGGAETTSNAIISTIAIVSFFGSFPAILVYMSLAISQKIFHFDLDDFTKLRISFFVGLLVCTFMSAQFETYEESDQNGIRWKKCKLAKLEAEDSNFDSEDKSEKQPVDNEEGGDSQDSDTSEVNHVKVDYVLSNYDPIEDKKAIVSDVTALLDRHFIRDDSSSSVKRNAETSSRKRASIASQGREYMQQMPQWIKEEFGTEYNETMEFLEDEEEEEESSGSEEIDISSSSTILPSGKQRQQYHRVVNDDDDDDDDEMELRKYGVYRRAFYLIDPRIEPLPGDLGPDDMSFGFSPSEEEVDLLSGIDLNALYDASAAEGNNGSTGDFFNEDYFNDEDNEEEGEGDREVREIDTNDGEEGLEDVNEEADADPE